MRKHKHVGVYAIISDNNEVILIKKSRGAYTGKLDLPGGTLEHGEKPIEGLEREIMEEVGITVNNIKLFDVFTNQVTWDDIDDKEDLYHIGILYVANANDNILKSDSDGLDSLGASWYNINELKKESLSPFAFKAIEYLKNIDYNK